METIPLFMWIAFGAVCAYMAQKQEKNPYLWFFLGMFLGLVGVFILFFSPKISRKRQESQGPTTIDVTPTVSQEDQEKFWYYLDPQNKQFGPMSFDALKRAWNEGQVTLDTYVWNENLDGWKRCSEFAGEKAQLPTSFKDTRDCSVISKFSKTDT